MIEESYFIPTRASMLKKNTSEDFQAVTFESYKSKKQKEKHDVTVKNTQKIQQNDFNIKQAKHEIIKLGMSGFDRQKKQEAKTQLLIKLGAKPPKNKCKNYKLLQAEHKKSKEKEASKLQFQQLGKNSIGKANAKGKSFDRKRRKEKKGDILDIYGKVKATNNSKQL
ncbi:hypothetical protein NQ318_018330 [Aromia moschata]|uniref:Uncharacterized protein n=1 Tax=Aromia moschata TaxID=1265417 RepID=A0AAV8ZFN5_9CUCU|nr:hypothetical protein NQ318_018330 [Aromia moschata]